MDTIDIQSRRQDISIRTNQRFSKDVTGDERYYIISDAYDEMNELVMDIIVGMGDGDGEPALNIINK